MDNLLGDFWICTHTTCIPFQDCIAEVVESKCCNSRMSSEKNDTNGIQIEHVEYHQAGKDTE